MPIISGLIELRLVKSIIQYYISTPCHYLKIPDPSIRNSRSIKIGHTEHYHHKIQKH
jgi:hypothetical protein